MLTKRQRNAIFETLSANGLAPETCALQDPASCAVTVASIRHEASGSSFTLWPDHDQAGKYGASTSVGSADFGRCSAYDWDQLLDKLASWTQEVRYQIDTPDLWAEFKQLPKIPAAAGGEASNALFTSAEQAEIANRLDEIKNLVREHHELTAEQMSGVEQTLDQVKEASERVGRKDWLMVLYGAAFGLIVNDSVPPHVVQGILSMVVHGLAHIFGLGGPPPVILS